ncbi:MAG: hypothetical protein B6243_10760 [Anaerolineaceae bacterium 4572_5.2]|nr:MAG: hypothetical protein B6243_10760 [Anaerolineaceae bacterium 4572_5.2]
MQDKPLRVCYFGAYRVNYSRNQIMIAGLRPLWRGIEDRIETAGGGWASFGFMKRIVSVYARLLKQYFSLGKDYDVMVLGYPGQLDVFLARLLTWFHRKPLVLDLFMSIYLIALERDLDTQSKFSIRLLRKLEWAACRLPDLLICDTEAYRDWHKKTHGLQPERFRLVPTGADDRVFKPVEIDKPDDGLFRVLYYGTFIPNHGVKYIIEAANLLQDHPEIQFELVGRGPDKALALYLAKEYNLQNVVFTDWVEKDDLPQKIANADMLLGVFGNTPQSLMTVQNKIYEGLAMSKAMVTGYSLTVSKILTHRQHIYLCERNNSESLAEAILDLNNNLTMREYLADNGRALYLSSFTPATLGEKYKEYLQEVQHT